MKIGGLQPVTLLDYPEKVTAIIFASGCNMRCPFCYNPRLVLPEFLGKDGLFKEAEVLDFLKKRKKYLDGVVLTGGEPTIQTGLIGFLKKIKKLGYLVKLDTNGLMPEVIEKMIAEKLVDYLAMDIKGPLSQYEKFCGVSVVPEKIVKSIAIIKVSRLPYEFRSTLVKGLHRKKDVAEMAKLIKGAEKYFLQNFNSQERLVKKDFSGWPFSTKEMKEFCAVAGGFVKKCGVR